MADNTNSRGFAIDHDGVCLEDGISDSCAPFAITGAVFQELFAGSGLVTTNNHLETEPVEDVCVKTSSSGESQLRLMLS